MSGRQIKFRTLQARTFSSDLWRYTFDSFATQVGAWPPAGYGTPGGTAGNINYMQGDNAGSNGTIYEYNLWSAQTIVAPVWSAGNGLDVSLDQTNARGAEYVPGGSDGTYGKHKAVLGPGTQLLTGTPPAPLPADPNNNCIF